MSDDDPRQASSPERRAPVPAYAAIFLPPAPDRAESGLLREIAQAFSPRYEHHRDDLVSIDVTGLERLLGSWRAIGDEIMRAVLATGARAHVAVAGTRMAALLLAHARPGLTVIVAGEEAAALTLVPVAVLTRVADSVLPPRQTAGSRGQGLDGPAMLATLTHWALRTLGELSALPAADLTARVGRQALAWQAMARGEDIRPLVPTQPDERFAGSLELEWPIDGLEPLSFVLTRLLEPLSTQLERRDRGAAVLHVTLDLVTRDVHARHLQLPSPIRDVRTLRTLALLDIEAHPPAAAIDRITVVIDPTPGRIVQHTLFTRALPTPEQVSTLLARLGAVMGQDRMGAPAPVDSYRPGAFALRPFATEHRSPASALSAASAHRPVSALRRCRPPVPARVVVDAGQPVRVTSDRRGFAGGSVVAAAGPWRSSGEWWADAGPTHPTSSPHASCSPWESTEWDLALSDGAMYRVYHDERRDAWYIEGMFD